MAKRLNDTRAIVERPMPQVGGHSSVTVRPMSGGGAMVTRCGPGGQYEETFHKNPPRIIPARVETARDTTDSEGLRASVEFMNRPSSVGR